MIKKRYLIMFIGLMMVGLSISVFQYMETMKTEIANAAQTIPNPGHSWASMESGPDSIQVTGRTITNLATPTASTDAVNKSYADSLGSMPSGVILFWSGSIASIPSGWALCNGSNGTPDLRDKFVVGAGSTYAVTATGGEATHILTAAEMPSHSHTDPAHSHSFSGSTSFPYYENSGTTSISSFPKTYSYQGQYTLTISGSTSSSSGGSTGSAGSGGAHNNLPPYYSLAYIMKI